MASFQFLLDANNKSEWLWNIYFKYAMGGFGLNILMTALISVLHFFYKYGHFDDKHLYKAYHYVLPWDQRTPCGYFGDILFSIVTAECYFPIHGAVIILFISMCWYHQAFYKRFRHSVHELNNPENTRNAKEILCELLYFHITVKDWFLYSTKVYSPFVLIQMICNMLALACCLFQFDNILRLKHVDLEITFVLLPIVTAMFNLFMYCYFGMMATESFRNMADCLYESNWRKLPLDMQKFVLLMIENMQKQIYYHGFGVAVLNLQAFIRFMRAVLTYYIAFKTITRE